METATGKIDEEGMIRRLTEEWVDALRARDLDRMMKNYSPDVTVFDISPPLQYVGAEAYRRKWEQMFKSIEGPIGYEVREMTVTAGDEVAFCHCLNRISGKMKGGKGNDGAWIRVTVCFRKVDGRWMVTHEHASVPFDGKSGKASLDLKP
ncbi:MAG TPA: SgcJ/EcaC family oxidoreductase [Blastocatellia bacterium]|nr:SgcJ/EcaC family oxidoreductase [Blastocatellia bacterium]